MADKSQGELELDALLKEWLEVRKEILLRVELQQRLLQSSALGVGLAAIGSLATRDTNERSLPWVLLAVSLLCSTLLAVFVEQDRMIMNLGHYLGPLSARIRQLCGTDIGFTWEKVLRARSGWPSNIAGIVLAVARFIFFGTAPGALVLAVFYLKPSVSQEGGALAVGLVWLLTVAASLIFRIQDRNRSEF
jgi:hypothetical protein